MSVKIKDYQVLDVFCGGTFYKVRHKVTNNIFAWKAYDCSTYSDDQIQNVINEVKKISEVSPDNLLRYHDTILHSPSKTLYFVLEYCSWSSVQELVTSCKATDKYVAEGFIWHLLLGLARVCKALEDVHTLVLQKCISASSVFVNLESGELRINCFELKKSHDMENLMQQVGKLVHSLCYRPGASDDKIREFQYSDDLRDVASFLTDDRSAGLRADVVLYHPTVLANQPNMSSWSKLFHNILVSSPQTPPTSEVNKCDSEKAGELCRPVEPLPRKNIQPVGSPIYSNVSTKRNANKENEKSRSNRNSLSPTLAALALELPGYVPRSRRPYSEIQDCDSARQVSEDTLSHQWMSRLVALRQRERSLNKRERDLITKEIIHSPSTKIIPLNESLDECSGVCDGITLPPLLGQMRTGRSVRRRRAGSLRRRRKSYGYEELDSSLSADAGDSSMIVTAAKITAANMPRRSMFPELCTKKVHFTASNPFVESDESVTLTFYELDNLDEEGYEVPRKSVDITNFKYLDSEKMTSVRRSTMSWSQSSPSKQARGTKNIFSDITNSNLSSIRKTPSKSSLTSRVSSSSRYSTASCRTEGGEAALPRTPAAPPDVKKSKSRKSLLPFKTPFKFKTNTKV